TPVVAGCPTLRGFRRVGSHSPLRSRRTQPHRRLWLNAVRRTASDVRKGATCGRELGVTQNIGLAQVASNNVCRKLELSVRQVIDHNAIGTIAGNNVVSLNPHRGAILHSNSSTGVPGDGASVGSHGGMVGHKNTLTRVVLHRDS